MQRFLNFLGCALIGGWVLAAVAHGASRALPHDASIVAVRHPLGAWLVIGGMIDGKWMPATRLGRNLRPSIRCDLYSLTARVGNGTQQLWSRYTRTR